MREGGTTGGALCGGHTILEQKITKEQMIRIRGHNTRHARRTKGRKGHTKDTVDVNRDESRHGCCDVRHSIQQSILTSLQYCLSCLKRG